ncbi:[NiFe]-hydrogenase assembly chaperone HybE [Aestuariibacter sp. GS-14]|uniref:[NiFe]-hydrogenase assembly chaperone HybE n=1 Tax=Aestuariibacter sp. GS-14 TaxID=2590670 RepID=UPI00112A2F35|nr:[NiFe]-hydrogenase assembly chaperone HybE [Aestuariibacter sp. GS-14]TPV60678.1 [NiFe]-hydrogenase assembly chaperone HybE [Aestuariibacter sp. GS-14]
MTGHKAAAMAFYQSVIDKMAGLPFYNEQLSIDTTPFREWDAYVIGVVVTPWCMNMLLLPNAPATLADLRLGQKFRLHFPSGQYEFIYAYDEQLGDYATCSVFSPMFEFTEQTVAMETATAVLAALFDEQHNSESERHRTKQAIVEQHRWLEEQATKQTQQRGESDSTDVTVELTEGLSRRAFLTGGSRKSEAGQS